LFQVYRDVSGPGPISASTLAGRALAAVRAFGLTPGHRRQPGALQVLQKGNPEFSYAPWQNLYFRSGADIALIYKGHSTALCLY
jgi:hypothetical protein